MHADITAESVLVNEKLLLSDRRGIKIHGDL